MYHPPPAKHNGFGQHLSSSSYMYANRNSMPPSIFPYLSISVIPHPPDKDQQVPKEGHGA